MTLSALLPVAIPLVVRLIDRLFGGGNGRTKKLPTAQKIIAALVEQFQTPGVALPGPDEQTAMIEQAVAALNATGQLKGEETALATSQLDPAMVSIVGSLVEVNQTISQAIRSMLAKAKGPQ